MLTTCTKLLSASKKQKLSHSFKLFTYITVFVTCVSIPFQKGHDLSKRKRNKWPVYWLGKSFQCVLSGLAKRICILQHAKYKAFCHLACVKDKKLFEMIGYVYAERFCVNPWPFLNLLTHV